jgi:hypothetical protein
MSPSSRTTRACARRRRSCRGSVRPGRAVRLHANGLRPPHLGQAKTYTEFDFLLRLLRACGFAVTHVPTITEVDDKMIRRARELRIDAAELSRVYERASLDDMRVLRTTPSMYTRARNYAGQVIGRIERLQQTRPSLCAIAHAHRPGRTCSGAGCR